MARRKQVKLNLKMDIAHLRKLQRIIHAANAECARLEAKIVKIMRKR